LLEIGGGVTRKTVLSIAFLSVTGVAVGWEIAAVANPHDNLEPWTNLIADHVDPAIAWAAILLLISWIPGHFVHAYAQRGKVMITTTIPATPDPGAAKEPLLSVGTVTALVAAAIAVATAFGLPLNDEQRGAVLVLVAAVAPFAVALAGRKKVFSPATTRAMVVDAAATGAVRTEAAVVPAEKPAGLVNPGAGERIA
jgi:hypothetical protein